VVWEFVDFLWMNGIISIISEAVEASGESIGSANNEEELIRESRGFDSSFSGSI
jgi:hypothetical protein